uniref:Uncharacterized protein n=1 Tax=Mycobacterium riyadhense TaxID=486698 RepID=A0A653ENX6_9MYCO|nr:hypothetical protein BIN_B_02946 [Mycobacterium riyadhense]
MLKTVQSAGPTLNVAGINILVEPPGMPMLNETAGPVAVTGARVTELITPVSSGTPGEISNP